MQISPQGNFNINKYIHLNWLKIEEKNLIGYSWIIINKSAHLM